MKTAKMFEIWQMWGEMGSQKFWKAARAHWTVQLHVTTWVCVVLFVCVSHFFFCFVGGQDSMNGTLVNTETTYTINIYYHDIWQKYTVFLIICEFGCSATIRSLSKFFQRVFISK